LSLVVNTNIASMNAQRSLANGSKELQSAMERLSSGKKINSAADDAAGFAIAELMTAQVRGLNVAIKNANDGLSLLAVVENGLSDVTDILQRVRELSVQAANGTNSAVDRANLATEASSLINEIDRIASDTTFNGFYVLSGFSQDVKVQVGYNDGQNVGLDFSGSYSSMLGIADGFGKTAPLGTLDTSDLTGNGDNTVVDLSSYQNSHEVIGRVLNHNNWYGSSWGYGTPDANYQAQSAFVHFEDGSSFEVATFFPDTNNANAAATLEIAASLSELEGKAGLNWSVSGGGVSAIDLEADPSSALTTIDIALNQVASEKAKLGADQNRFGYVVTNLMNVAENTTAAQSRIRDADFAVEAARLAKAQVLQQTGTAMLAQANAAPQLVLSLIR
jgi:flagellin